MIRRTTGSQIAGQRLLLFSALLAGFIGSAPTLRASDAHVRDAIFSEQHVEGTAFKIHRRAAALPTEARFEFLANWVLPGPQHSTLRVQTAFSPTDPPPPTSTTQTGQVPEARQRSGGTLVSPVLDLIDAATELDRLEEVRQRVASWQPPDTAGTRNQIAVLALIELSRDSENAALPHIEKLLALRTGIDAQDLPGLRSNSDRPSEAELLILERGFDAPALHDLMAEFIAFFRPWLISDFDRPIPHRHVSRFLARLLLEPEKAASEKELLRLLSRSPLTQWHTASRSTARTRGEGHPPTDWLWRPGFAANVDSHDDDYLIFNTPLTGNYEVECDVTGFEWRDSSLLAAGNWVAPIYTHKHVDVGSFRGPRPRIAFEPPLTRVGAWLHYRTVVRDGTATTFINGRPIHTEALQENHGPWLAYRSTRQHDGAVRNLRITGTPKVPEHLQLSAVETLNDWLPYYEGVEAAVNQPLWYVSPRGGSNNEITGLGTNPGEIVLAGDGQRVAGQKESLLRYFRPMVEDGEIEYEFYYVPGQLQAHPALDRLAFLLLPDGVRIHWITDGPYDRTGLASDNTADEPSCRRGAATLPLRIDDWNNLKLTLQGDTITLTLNGQLIYERPLEPTNQRTFGLFHFSDWSTLLVRRVVWRGDWPRELPSLADQELALPDGEFLDDDLDRLTANFEHDFARDGLPLSRFNVVRGNIGTQIMPTSRGLLATREGTGGYQNATVAPALRISGDFDVTVEYDDFQSTTAAVDGKTSLTLLAILDNDTDDEFYMSRRHYSKSADNAEQLLQCVTVNRLPEGVRRDFFVKEIGEETSGRFRIARRGDRVYFLTAEGDSPHFRLRGQRAITDDDVDDGGLRLFAQIYNKGGRVSAIWKTLSIRAEKLAGRALEQSDVVLTELNKQRDKLPGKFTHDFRAQAPTRERFYQWAIPGTWQAGPDGWLIASPGGDSWKSSGAAPEVSIEGDFDVTLRFKPDALALPRSGKRSQVYLQIDPSDEKRSSLNTIFSLEPNGETMAFAQVRERDRNGKDTYKSLGHMGLRNAHTLRITRRGSTVTFLAADKDSDSEHILAQYVSTDLPVPQGNIRIMLHTGGAGLTSRVHWQAIDIRAERLQVAPAAVPPPPKLAPGSKPSRSLFDRVVDFFK